MRKKEAFTKKYIEEAPWEEEASVRGSKRAKAETETSVRENKEAKAETVARVEKTTEKKTYVMKKKPLIETTEEKEERQKKWREYK